MKTQTKMTEAKIKKNGVTVFIHEGVAPQMDYNNGKVVVSKQPNSMCTFCIDKSELELI